MAKHRNPSEWATLLRAYRRSNCTQAEFCHRHGVAVATFSYQLRKQREMADVSQASHVGPPVFPPSLIEVHPPQESFAMESSGIRMELNTHVGVVSVHCAAADAIKILAGLTAS